MVATDARDVLHGRLAAVFDEDFLHEAYPHERPLSVPKVLVGFPPNEPPFYVAVDEITDTMQTSGAATMGHANWEFVIRVWCFAQHKEQQVAADTLMAYVDAVFKAVLADQTLNGTVDNCFPSIESAGTASDSSKRYVAAASVALTCRVFSGCPAAMLELVRKTNERQSQCL